MNKHSFSTNKNGVLQLELKATEMRKQILKMIVAARGTHIVSAFSILDLTLFLYSHVLNVNPRNPKELKRDRFVLSKGHGCAALYVVLADFGFFPKHLLESYTSPGSILGGHPDSLRIPGVEISTGSLGHGLSVSVGFALANKINKIQSRIYCLVSDGECNEGAIWEATMVAAHYKLDNLVLILDNNRLMISGFTKDILNPLSFSEKFRAFGWNIIEINGHNFNEMTEAFEQAPLKNGKPTVIIANTIRGKGISYMENSKEWYSMLPNEEQMGVAMEELNAKIEKIEKSLQK